jgi:hypothetical protein
MVSGGTKSQSSYPRAYRERSSIKEVEQSKGDLDWQLMAAENWRGESTDEELVQLVIDGNPIGNGYDCTRDECHHFPVELDPIGDYHLSTSSFTSDSVKHALTFT